MQNSEQINYQNQKDEFLSNEKHLSELIYNPNNPPWGVWAAIGVWFASVLFILIFPSIFVLPYLARQPFGFSDGERLKEFAMTDPTAILLQLSAIIPAHLLTILLGWLVVTKFRKYSFTEMVGWKWNGFKIWHAFGFVIFFYAVSIVLISIFGEVENDFEKMLKSSRTAVYFVAFFATFTAPLVEEMVYRGLLFSSLQKRLGMIWAVILVTLLFTLVHVPQYSQDRIPDYASVLTILILSLSLTLIRVKTKNLLPCIVLHTVFNGLQSILMIAQPFIQQAGSENHQTAIFFWN